MASKYTITPWRSQRDLLEVRSQLYRVDPLEDRRRHAIDRVMAWKLRGNLPHAVESTALLTDAILHHSNPDNSIFSIRAVYSAAFTRFVTGFCDIGRNRERSLEPSSMLDIAKQIGMPVEFVALRHEATHEELPAVQRLVKAVDDALGWLWTVYWSRLDGPTTEEAAAVSLEQMKAEARQILRGFRSRRREAVKNKRKYKYDFSDIQQTMWASLDFFGKDVAKMEAYIDVLIGERLLNPSKRELGSSMEGAYVIWEDLLRFTIGEQKRLAPALIKGLLEGIGRPSEGRVEEDAEKESLCLWINHLLYPGPLRPFFMTTERHTLRKDVLQWCCMHPGYWSERLGRNMLKIQDEENEENGFDCGWEEIFEASLLGKGGDDAPVLGPPSPGFLKDMSWDRFGSDHFCEYPGRESKDDAGLGNWVQAPTPYATPIGVVR